MAMAMVSRLLPNNGVWRVLSFESLYRYSTIADAPHPQTHSLLDYLISTLGFSKEEAIITTKKVRPARSFRRDPDLVVNFLLNSGLSKTQIKGMVYVQPKILSYDVEKTLAPKIRVLQEIGISGSDFGRVVMCYKSILVTSNLSVDYLRNLMGSDKLVVKLIKKRGDVLHPMAPKIIASNVELMRKIGFSSADIIRLMLNLPVFILRSPDYFQRIMERVENDFGISPQSKMFHHGVAALSSIGDSKLATKFEIFRSFGWSNATIYSMVGRFPYILQVSEDKIRTSWNFFVKELRFPPDYLATRPVIVSLNFEKRVKPRAEVLTILKEKKLVRKLGLYGALISSESKFVNDYLLPYKDVIPDVCDSYFKIVGREKAENF